MMLVAFVFVTAAGFSALGGIKDKRAERNARLASELTLDVVAYRENPSGRLWPVVRGETVAEIMHIGRTMTTELIDAVADPNRGLAPHLEPRPRR